MNAFLERWVPQRIRKLRAYHVPSAEGLLKLDAMENPYTLPDDLKQGWLDSLTKTEINRYPDPGADALKASIRKVFGIADEHAIILGNGSDELIQMAAMLVGGAGRSFMSPEPSFSMYRIIASVCGADYIECPLDDGFRLNSARMLELIDHHQPACVFLAYPNNPTGNTFDREQVEQIIAAAPGLVLVDEAYHSFCGRSFVDRLPHYPNLLVMRTLSKSGLAGLRLGIMTGSRLWINELEKIRLPYNINVLTQASARYCLEHYPVFQEQAATIVENRQWLTSQLSQRQGVRVYPSETNFVLVRLQSMAASRTADAVFSALKANGVLIKNLHGSSEALDNCLRITVGTRQQCAQFMDALDRSLQR